MSARNRAGSKSDPDELYETPTWATRLIIDRLWPDETTRPVRWLEPCAGRGAIVREILQSSMEATATCVEILPQAEQSLRDLDEEHGGLAIEIGNFFETAVAQPPRNPFSGEIEPPGFQVVLMNPPFSSSLLFVQQCLPLAERVVALLRLNWLGGVARHTFLREYCPDVYVLPQRPSFRPDGGTDATEYAWMVWRGDRKRSSGIVEVLPLVSDAERGIRRGKKPKS